MLYGSRPSLKKGWPKMASNGSYLPPRKQKAVISLLEYPTVVAAAEASGVGYRTLCRWLSEDESFKNAIRAAQQQALHQTVSQLAGASPSAARVLSEIAEDESVPAAVRVQAASRIINELRRSMELLSVRDEINHLKEVLDELEAGN